MAPKVELLIGFWPLPFFTHTKPIAFASMNTHKLSKNRNCPVSFRWDNMVLWPISDRSASGSFIVRHPDWTSFWRYKCHRNKGLDYAISAPSWLLIHVSFDEVDSATKEIRRKGCRTSLTRPLPYHPGIQWIMWLFCLNQPKAWILQNPKARRAKHSFNVLLMYQIIGIYWLFATNEPVVIGIFYDGSFMVFLSLHSKILPVYQ